MRRSLFALALAALVLAACGQEDAPQTSAGPHNEADVAFAIGMVPHHQQANLMADMAAMQAASEEVKALARRIKAGQQAEVEQMQGWLSSWKVAVPASHGGHAGHGAAHPGMLNEAQLGQLRSSAGDAFDKLFLAYMIFHHEGAVVSSHQVLNTGVFPGIKNLAGQIIETQQTEIAQMRQLLARLGGPLPIAIPSAPGQPPVPGAPSQLVATGPPGGQAGPAGAGPAQAVPGRAPGQPATGQPAAGSPAAPGQPATVTPTTQPPVYVPPPSGGGGGGGCTPEHQQQGHCS